MQIELPEGIIAALERHSLTEDKVKGLLIDELKKKAGAQFQGDDFYITCSHGLVVFRNPSFHELCALSMLVEDVKDNALRKAKERVEQALKDVKDLLA